MIAVSISLVYIAHITNGCFLKLNILKLSYAHPMNAGNKIDYGWKRDDKTKNISRKSDQNSSNIGLYTFLKKYFFYV